MCKQEPTALKSWGFKHVNEGLTVALYRRPDRLVIEIHAPMDLLNLDALIEDTAEPQLRQNPESAPCPATGDMKEACREP